jgi:hypothetical protein
MIDGPPGVCSVRRCEVAMICRAVILGLTALLCGCGSDLVDPCPLPAGMCRPAGGGDRGASQPDGGTPMLCGARYPVECKTDQDCLVAALCGNAGGFVDPGSCSYSCNYR